MNALPHDNSFDELGDLFARYADGTLTADETSTLEERLLADQAAKQQFVLYMDLHARLLWNERAELGETAFRSQPTDISKAESGKRKAEEETTDQSAHATHQTPLTNHHSTLRRWGRFATQHKLGTGIAAGLLFVLAVLGWAALTNLPGVAENEEPHEEAPTEWIARLDHTHNVKWLDGTEPPAHHPRLMPGQRLAISAGLLEIKFRTGAQVIVEGPAEFTVGTRKDKGERRKEKENDVYPLSFSHSPLNNSGYLAHGKLLARCETVESKGFAIETAAATIEDLGTEFGVEIDLEHLATVHVFRGRVKTTPAGAPASAITLVAGQSVSFTNTGVSQIATSQPRESFIKGTFRADALEITSQYVAAVKKSSPLVYWRFEEIDDGKILNEVSDRFNGHAVGNMAHLRSSATNHTIDFGPVALGQPTRFVVCDEPLAELAEGDYTVECWLHANNDQLSVPVGLFTHLDPATARAEGAAFCIVLNPATGTSLEQRARYLHRSPPGISGGHNAYSAPTKFVGNWVHVAAVKQGSQMQLYLDGQLAATANDSTHLSPLSQLVLGRNIPSRSGTERYFVGQIDEVALYNRAITPEEIRQHVELAAFRPNTGENANEND